MPTVTFRSAHVPGETREQIGFVWEKNSTLAVRERPSAGRTKIWSLQHTVSGMALDPIRPLWVRTKADLLWLAKMVDTNMADEVALMRFVPFGGGLDKMHPDIKEACLAVRRYALTLAR